MTSGKDNLAFSNDGEANLQNCESQAEEGAPSGAAERGQWGKKTEFMLTCIGYAVGLGNVWRFPYLCFKNGGGAFLIPYCLMLCFVGMPVFFFELSLGQFAAKGPISTWVILPLAKGVGFCSVSVSFMVALYYNVIITWAFSFLWRSFAAEVPWLHCDPEWSNKYCIPHEVSKDPLLLNQTMQNRSITYFETPSEQYFYRSILEMTDTIDEGGEPVYHLVLTCGLVWIIVFLALMRGVNSLGKVMYFVTTFPYIMLTALIINGCMLDGAIDGILYYITPDFNRLSDPQVWSDAATQIFFSLSACMGGLVAMGSFNTFKNNCHRDSIIVPIVNCCTSIFAGFSIFSVLGYMAKEKGLDDISQVTEAGPGLVFVVYPEALASMPFSTVWSILFFIMLILLGFSSSFSIVETIFVSIMDEFPEVLRKNKTRPIIFRGIGCAIFFLLSIPMLCKNGFFVFTLVEDFSGSIPLLLIGFFELSSITWIYGITRYAKDVKLMIGYEPNIFFKICWTVLGPVILLAVFIASIIQYEDVKVLDVEYPTWGLAMGWLILAFCVQWMPSNFIYQVCKMGLRGAASPTPEWQPSDPAYRTKKATFVPTGEKTDIDTPDVFTIWDEPITQNKQDFSMITNGIYIEQSTKL